MMSLAGRVAVVTGAARGIGLAVAERFVAAGASVVMADLAGSGVAQAAVSLGPQARGVSCDVTDAAQVADLVRVTVDTFGALDIMVANAGIAPAAPFLDLTPEQFRRVIDVNLTGSFLCVQAAAKQMLSQRGRAPGAMVLMASVQAQSVAETQTAYAASKGGVVQLTKAAAVALAPHWIRVNAVGPGSVSTNLTESALTPALRRGITARTPMGRLGRVEEIAEAVLFLASDAGSYITGQTLYVDGGRLALALTMPDGKDD
jgi:glucose 1-dehydrogenase